MRSDLQKKYHRQLEAEKDENNMHLFNHEINLDSANIKKDAEYENYFNSNIKNECQKDHCAFQTLTYEMLQKGNNMAVGMPIKLSLIEMYHGLIYDNKGEWDIFMVMRDHFISLKNDERKRQIYAWITYICLKGQFTRDEQLETELVKQIGIHIDRLSMKTIRICVDISECRILKQKVMSPLKMHNMFSGTDLSISAPSKFCLRRILSL